ncbi:MAG: hypothetical protein ACLUIQ_06935 [Dialister invisus]
MDIYLFSLAAGLQKLPDDGKLTRAVTTENVISSEDINIRCSYTGGALQDLFDGRFLVDKTAYGTASVEKIEGEVTVAEYLGYFTDREDSIFSRHLKVFGMGV